MFQETRELLERVLRLSRDARADLARRLSESLDAEEDPAEVDRACCGEIAPRVLDVTEGRVQTIPTEDARAPARAAVERGRAKRQPAPMTEAVRDLLRRALDLRPWERALVFDELFESLVGHDELGGLMDELERRDLLVSEPGAAVIERRVREALEGPKPGERWPTAAEVIDAARQKLAEDRPARKTRRPRSEPRLTGAAGDLAGEGVALSPAERGALALEILATIERSDTPSGPDDRFV